jgi:hypothetical protein
MKPSFGGCPSPAITLSTRLRLLLNRARKTTLLHTASVLCVLILTTLSISDRWPHSTTDAQGANLSVRLNVINGSMPVTTGIPIAESMRLLDISRLGVLDPTGTPLPAQMRVMSRWRGPVGDQSKSVKWLLLDFKPKVAGAHTLTISNRTAAGPLTTSVATASIRVSTTQLELELPRQGESLVRSFKIAGVENLRAPASLQMSLPRRVMINKVMGADTVIVTDSSLLKPGESIRFENTGTLRWDAAAGSNRLVTASISTIANRVYRVDEGTPRQEDVTVNTAEPGDLRAQTALKFNHAAGAAIRDLTVQNDAASISSISGQTIKFAAPLKLPHSAGEIIFLPNTENEVVTAVLDRCAIEEANALRVVVRQDGYFKRSEKLTGGALQKAPPTLGFTLRFYAYADQPFVRVRLRLINSGAYGFGASFSNQPPYAQHVLLRNLFFSLPTVIAGSGTSQVLTDIDAHARIARKESGASLTAGSFEISVPEFVENYPKALTGNSSGLRFDILPNTGRDHVFDGARAKTTDFYLGRNTVTARVLSSTINAMLDPTYVATTGAVRSAMIAKRDWVAVFGKDPQLGEAAARYERMIAASYAIEANDRSGSAQPMSAFEYRETSQNGVQFGWRNFGDLAWGDGYANVHYDLPFILLRESLRTGDTRAFRLGGEMARYRADWGQHQATDYLNLERTVNFKGYAFYEKGDHGSFREPITSHMWIEGLWLYWALTGDESMREAAVESSQAFYRMDFSGNLGGEARIVGWPVLGLVVAHRYTGESQYLSKAYEGVKMFLRAEQSEGSRGYTRADGPDGGQKIQVWGWSYSLLGVIEYWRETKDTTVGNFLLRVADWMVGKGSNNPPILQGRTLNDGNYQPYGVPYFWSPDKIAEDRAPVYAGLTLPVLVIAARISGRADLWDRARLIFRDYAFYRDLTEGIPVPPQSRHVINFRSPMYPGSSPKVYGQMGLTVSDYLPEVANYLGIKSTATPAPNATPAASPTATPKPSPTAEPTPVNIALNRPTTASSFRVWPGCICTPAAANDGLTVSGGAKSLWHSDLNTNVLEWWQVDLGGPNRIQSMEIVFREDEDQPSTRRNFEVLASNDAAFATSTRLAEQGNAPAPFRKVWSAAVTNVSLYRYVRIRKTKLDAGNWGELYFNLTEVRVFSKQSQTLASSAATSATSTQNISSMSLTTPSRDGTVDVSSTKETSPRKVLVGQVLDFTVSTFDQRGRVLQLYASNMPTGASFNASTGRFRFMPNSSMAGNIYQVQFRGMNDQGDQILRQDIFVQLDGAPEIRLLAPSPSQPVYPDKAMNISWMATNSTPIEKYQLRLSTDGGLSYPIVIAELPGTATQYQWTGLKNLRLNERTVLRVMIKATDKRNRSGIDSTRQDLRIWGNRNVAALK